MSKEAKARRLYDASNEKMAVRGIVDIQAMYNGTMVTLDGLVLESDLVAPLISCMTSHNYVSATCLTIWPCAISAQIQQLNLGSLATQ